MIKAVRTAIGGSLLFFGLFSGFSCIPASILCVLIGYILVKDVIKAEEEMYD